MLQSVETIKILQNNSQIKSFSAGKIIFHQGAEGKEMYGVIQGEVEMLVNNKVIETINEGDVFGQGALVHSDHLRASTARAKTDCQIAFLDRNRFLFAVQETLMFALEVMKSYSDRFRRLKHLI